MLEKRFTPEEEKAYELGFTQGFARSVEMQAKIRSKRDREHMSNASNMVEELIQAIGLDKFDLVIRFVEELGVSVIRR